MLLPASAGAAPPAPVTISPSTPKAVKRGQVTSAKLHIHNVGGQPLRGAVLSVRGGKGVAASIRGAKKSGRTLRLKQIPAGATIVQTLRLKGSRKAKSGTPTSVSVRAGAARQVSSVPIAFTGEDLVGRYFWNATFRGPQGLDVTGYYFSNRSYAYRGNPVGGLPNCTRTTAVGDKDGCLRYRYDARRDRLTVGGKTGKGDGTGFEIDDHGFSPLGIPAKGESIDGFGTSAVSFGFCPGVTCTVSISDMRITPDGQFARSSAVSGNTPSGSFAVLPPDAHGTYTIDAPGRIRLAFADGTVQVKTIGVLLNKAQLPDASEGFLLDSRPYTS